MVRGQHVYKSVWTSLTDRWCSKTRKCTPVGPEMMNVINTLQTIDCSNIRKGDANMKRDIENKLIFLNVWHHFKVY